MGTLASLAAIVVSSFGVPDEDGAMAGKGASTEALAEPDVPTIPVPGISS